MKNALAILLLLTGFNAFAHGEDKPGPHNGSIRMPGAFHTEVSTYKHGLKIMLLDINFQNPTVANSTLKVSIKKGKKTITLHCQPRKNYFDCPASRKLLSQKADLNVLATRDHAVGMMVVYQLPLRK